MSLSEVEGFPEQPLKTTTEQYVRFVPNMLVLLKESFADRFPPGLYTVEGTEPVPKSAQGGYHGAMHDQYVYVKMNGELKKLSGFYFVPASRIP